jgi:PAS domain S-box-containing protein
MVSAVGSPPETPLVDLRVLKNQAGEVLQEHLCAVASRTDVLLAGLSALQGIGIAVLAAARCRFASWQSPFLGPEAGLWSAVGEILLVVALARLGAGRPVTRHVVAVCLVFTSALLDRTLGGHWDWHFHIFAVLALLVFYRDWRVLLSASAAALLTPLLWGLPSDDPWGWVEHFGGIAAENVLLVLYCRQRVREMGWLTERRLLIQTTETLVDESFAKTYSSEAALQAVHQHMAQSHLEWEDGARLRAEELACANEALQRNNSVLRAQQEATTDGILVTDEHGMVSSCNQRFCEVWRLTGSYIGAAEGSSLLPHLLSLTKHPDQLQAMMERCDENPSEHARDEIELTDGRILERSTQPVFSDTGQYYGRVWYFRDITDRKRAESQVLGLSREMSHTNDAITRAYDATIEGWSRALDLRDRETEGHCQRVTELTLRLAVAMGLCGEDLIQIRRGALLHDIGKMGVPDAILLKPGPLTDAERDVMKRHPQYAYDLLSPIAFLRPALDIPWCHHEKWNGTGYPRGLKGEEIPLPARLFAFVDVWDALLSDRPYRKAWPEDRVRDYICSLSGTHFDPDLVPIFLSFVSPAVQAPDDDFFSSLDLFPAPELSHELRLAA